MQGYFKKKHRTHLDLLSIPRLWGGKTNKHRIHGKLGIQLFVSNCYDERLGAPICSPWTVRENHSPNIQRMKTPGYPLYVGVPFLVLFQKTDRAILVLATFHPPCCTADDLAFSNCRILTAKSCFKVLLFYDMKSYCHRSRAVVLYSCVMADFIASNNCKIKECFEVLLLVYI